MTTAFAGRVALVTGAASGIGEAVATALADAGATVFGTARDEASLVAARTRHPAVRWLRADVTRPAEIEGAIASLVGEAGRLDILVNNAAIFSLAPLAESTDEMIRGHFEVNVFGLVRVTRAALAALEASRGAIINISSAAGHKPAPGGAIYGATKAAVEALTKSWALELAPRGVRVNAVAPGPTETPGFDKLPAVKAAFVEQVPLGRMASPAEIARWVVAVADPSVTWMTGHVLAIDGGMSLT